MQTILTRLKTLIQDNMVPVDTATLGYVKSAEVVHPEIDITTTSFANLPRIVFTPIATSETWVASQTKEATNRVYAYLMLRYNQRETSIISDSTRPSGQGKGIINFVTDFLTVIRGHRLAVGGTNYLDKPLDIQNIDYIVERLGDASLLIAQIEMFCVRLFRQVTLPTNI